MDGLLMVLGVLEVRERLINLYVPKTCVCE